jgi:hypothetical protein
MRWIPAQKSALTFVTALLLSAGAGCEKKDEPEPDAVVRLDSKPRKLTAKDRKEISPETRAKMEKFLDKREEPGAPTVPVTSLNATRIDTSNQVVEIPQDKLVVRGQLSKSTVSEILRVHEKKIKHCYAKGLARDPDLEGKVVMEWVIGATGVVSVVKTKQNTMTTPRLGMCLAAVIKSWKYPPPRKGVAAVTQEFVFKKIDAGAAPPACP